MSLREIVFDTETTGFDPERGDRVVEIGGVEMIDGVLTGEHFHVFVNPKRDMPESAFRVHGLSAEFLSKHEPFEHPSVGERFVDFVGDARLVAHNASFDVKFMNWELANIGLPKIPQDRVVDTLEIARKKFPGASNSLDALCKRFEISLEARDKHGALIDSELLAGVYIELTGGKQRRLGLFAGEGQSDAAERDAVRSRRAPRPTPLKTLATEEERAAHAQFIAEMGEKAVWVERGLLDETEPSVS